MKKIDCYRAMKITKTLVYGGWLVMMVSIFAGYSIEGVRSVVIYPILISFLVSALGLFCGLRLIKCPHCRRSLMSGAKIPKELPEFCPGCGERL